MNKCPVCSNAVRHYKTLFDDRYGYPGLFQLTRCDHCGHMSLQTTFSPGSLTRLYTDYYTRSAIRLEDYHPHKEVSGFRAWLNGERCSAYAWVPENVRVIDIGCGFGETLGYHKERGCEVYGVEADENIRRVAERYGFKVHVGLFDPDLYEPGSFDYVTMDQVIEHMSNPVEALRGVARVLKPGGVAILSTPNANGWGARLFGRYWINWHAPYHLHHFSGKSMAMAAEQAGMALEQVRIITSSEWLFYQWIHLVTFPKMGVPSSFWVSNGKLQGKNK
jgi:2-polyprenyl-3-methyl-5-hydroxy-6-metoxy-1,4-benzoquinol methylase